MDNLTLQLILVALVTLLASYVQSVTGFGFGIFAMIFLPKILLFTEANALSTILSTLTSVTTVALVYKRIHWKNLIFPVIGCLASTFFAVFFIKNQKNDTITLLLGIALLLLSIYFFFFSEKIKIKPTFYAGLIAGVLSGIMGGMFSIGGPPVVIYFLQSEDNSEKYLATLSAYFIFSGIISVGAKAAAGFITKTVLIAIAIGVVAMLVGSFVGKKTRDKTKPKTIRKAIYLVMAFSGITNIITSLL